MTIQNGILIKINVRSSDLMAQGGKDRD